MTQNVSINKLQLWQKLVIFWLGVSVVELLGLLNTVRSASQAAWRPSWEVSANLITRLPRPLSAGWQIYSLQRSLQTLETEHSVALARLAELEHLQQENLALRKLLENQDVTSQQVRIAAPIASYGLGYINRGQLDGITPQALVFVSGTFVGRISELSDHQAKVTLLIEPQSEGIVAQTSNGVSGLIRGNGKNLIFSEVASDAQVNLGDVVVTKGQAGIPQGLLIGKLQKLISPASSPVQIFTVEPTADFYQTSLVEVRP
jgi:cell shape-determining protein MreC